MVLQVLCTGIGVTFHIEINHPDSNVNPYLISAIFDLNETN